ncbi:MAG: glutamate mutase L [Candidatus Zixiibacteriota bacterium]
MYYGIRIRKARLSKKYTQAELADIVGVTRQTIGLIESGKYNPSLKLCIDIAIALDKTLNELFWVEGSGIKQYDLIFITDIGSTTTKGLLIKQVDGNFVFAAQAEVPTTVESPLEDVKIGIVQLAKKISKISGEKIITDSGKLRVPYITTSSAGGGLQILVFGLSSSDTGKAAEYVALGAGGVVLRTFTIDDKIPAIEKMRLIKELHPDLILMAGGMDGGNIAVLVRLSEILSLANPTPKFHQSERIPLVFCGNKNARGFIQDVLKEKFDVHIVENIRPNPDNLNPVPARNMIHKLFMENVMERAPGYSKVKKWVERDILPTPTGVENMLKLYSENENKNTLMVDIGGATTDVFTNINGNYKRTVAANIGMSYSMSNILAEAGIDDIKNQIPKFEGKDLFDENIIRDYIANKTLNPTYTPNETGEFIIEQATAISGIKKAWEKHKELNFEIAHIGFLDRMKRRVDIDPFQEVFYGEASVDFFQFSDIDVIIGAGGVFSHLANKGDAMKMLCDAFMPNGITKLVIDKNFKAPHMGILSTIDDEVALELFEKECIEEIGYIIAPTGKMDSKKTALTVREKNSEIGYSVKGGDVLYLKNPTEIVITTSQKINIFKGMEEVVLKTNLPVLIDCRGREEFYNEKSLAEYDISDLKMICHEYKTNVQKGAMESQKGNYSIKRELPYEGKIFVEEGQNVIESTIIGENTYTPPKLYIIDIHSFIGYDKEISEGQMREYCMVEEGDKVDIGMKIFQEKTILSHNLYRSPVRGQIISIKDNGVIVLREIQDYSDKPVKVDIAGWCDVKPKYIKNFLRFDEGDFITKGQILVKKQAQKLPLTAPSTGILKEIDNEKGTITIQYDVEPIAVDAFVRGEISRVITGYSAIIEGIGQIIYGLIGFGGENYGKLKIVGKVDSIDESFEDKIAVVEESIDEKFLKKAEKFGLKGIIAPSIENSEWISYFGKEIGIALTGDERIPFTLILTEGFGALEMTAEHKEIFRSFEGRIASLSGRTQIRAGVSRPQIIIPEK